MTITVESLEKFFSPVAMAELQLRISTLEVEADKLMQEYKRRYLMPPLVEMEYQRRKAAIATWEDIRTLAKDILYLVNELKEIEGKES